MSQSEQNRWCSIKDTTGHSHKSDTGFRRTRYTAVIEPTLKRFDLRSNWRIFQAQTVPDIITSVARRHDIEAATLSVPYWPDRDIQDAYAELILMDSL
nr:contractile injection system protein, VgrG/Pvc8 family [Pseudomonas sp. NDM]